MKIKETTLRFFFNRLLEVTVSGLVDRQEDRDRQMDEVPRLIIYDYFIVWLMFRPQLIPDSGEGEGGTGAGAAADGWSHLIEGKYKP